MVKAVGKLSGYPGLKPPHFYQNSFCPIHIIRRRNKKKLESYSGWNVLKYMF